MCCNILCCFGCLSICGCRDPITRRLVFLPPEPSYLIQHEEVVSKKKGDESSRIEVCMYLVNEQKPEYGIDSTLLQYTVIKNDIGNEVSLYFLPYPNSDFTIIFSHGNATDIGQMRDFLLDMRKRLQVNVVAYDYSGYGLSTGTPSVRATLSDISAVYKYTKETLRKPSQQIILYGQSLGTGVSCEFAKLLEDNIAGCVLHSPLLSGLRVVSNVKKTYWFDIYPTIDNILKLECPVWIIHGTSDDLIPVWHGYKLSRLVKHRHDPWFVDGGRHNDIEIIYRDEFFNRFEDFISALRKTAKRGVQI